MARHRLNIVARNKSGRAQPTARVFLYTAGTTTEFNVYSAASGGSVLDQPLITDEWGEVEPAYIEAGTYDCRIIFGSGITERDYTRPYFAGSEAGGDVATHEADTTNVHGITDTTVLATDAEVASAVSAHTGDATAAHAGSAISFTPAGTIAATNVQAAIAEVATEGFDLGTDFINVRDAGVTGDGTTDDTDAIQAVLDDAGVGGTVWFPEGQYKVSDQGSGFCLDISTLSGITLAGQSTSGLNPSGEGTGSCIFTTSTSTTIIKSNAAAINHRGPKLLDLRIESRSASANGMSVTDFNHLVLERVTFRGVGQAGSATSTGLLVTGTEDASYGRIQGCYFHRHLYGLVTDGSVGMTISGSSYFDSNVTNHVLLDLQNTASAVVVMGTKFQCNHVSGAIAIRHGEVGATLGGDVQILGNNFEGCTTGVDLMSRGSLGITGTVVGFNSFVGTDASETGIKVGTNRRTDQIIGNRFNNLATGQRVVDSGTETLIIGGRTDQGSIAGEFLNFGGVYVGMGTGAPSVTVADGSIYLRSGTGLYVRQGSAWVRVDPTSAALTSSSNYVTSDVTMTTNGTFYDGPTLTLAAGTWLLNGAVQLLGSTTAVRVWQTKLWDGTTITSQANHRTEGTGQTASLNIPLSALVSPGSSTTYKISATSSVDGDTLIATGVKTSYLNAVKIA